METAPLSVRDGDVVIVRASQAPDGRLNLAAAPRYALIEWGTFRPVSDRLASLSTMDEALIEARLCAAERDHNAWDATGREPRRLPRLPLVYRSHGDTYSVSLDVSDGASPSLLQWKSAANLSAAEALAAMRQDGIPPELAAALLGKAPMPDACA